MTRLSESVVAAGSGATGIARSFVISIILFVLIFCFGCVLFGYGTYVSGFGFGAYYIGHVDSRMLGLVIFVCASDATCFLFGSGILLLCLQNKLVGILVQLVID